MQFRSLAHNKKVFISNNNYSARIGNNGEYFNLGIFENEEESARAYDAKAVELHKEYAYLNFPND